MLDRVIYLTARALYYGDVRCEPGQMQNFWNSLSQEDKEWQLTRAKEWLLELERTSPKSFKFLMSNYNDI